MKKELKEALEKEEIAAFEGWDFSHLNGRWQEEELPWDYKKIVERYLKSTDVLLDMGTGGGEFLLSLEHPYKLTSVTEGYRPNFELCQRKLGTLGIDVKYADGEGRLPFGDDIFDIVINRHEAYLPEEVKRILKPGGVFITQQVGGDNNVELSLRLTGKRRKLMPDWNMKNAAEALESCGFKIVYKNEYFPKVRFYDTGSLVYFAKVIEWEFPDFSVAESESELEKIDGQIRNSGFFESVEHRFVIAVRKQ